MSEMICAWWKFADKAGGKEKLQKFVPVLTLGQDDILQFLHSLCEARHVSQQGWDVLDLDGRALWAFSRRSGGQSPFALAFGEHPRMKRQSFRSTEQVRRLVIYPVKNAPKLQFLNSLTL